MNNSQITLLSLPAVVRKTQNQLTVEWLANHAKEAINAVDEIEAMMAETRAILKAMTLA
jgi:hypothetical protein